MSETLILRPCPFCGRRPVAADLEGGGPAYWVHCYDCEANGPVGVWGAGPGSAVARWNMSIEHDEGDDEG